MQDFKNMQRGQAQAGSNGVAPAHHNLDTAKQVRPDTSHVLLKVC